MRVVSLVPSWTETLLEAGVEVVGRTRFCIHPKSRVGGIPRVGGTKDWNWPRIVSLKPDLVLLDREENPKFMGDQTEIPFHVTHVKSVEDMPQTFMELARILKNEQLKLWGEEWLEILKKPPQKTFASSAKSPRIIGMGSEAQNGKFQMPLSDLEGSVDECW